MDNAMDAATLDAVANAIVPGDPSRAPGEANAEDLAQLIHKAILARRIVEMHRHAVRQCLHAARAAGRTGDIATATKLLTDARGEHLQAQTCTRFARQCETRAGAIGVQSGAYAAIGRGMRVR